MVADTFDIIMSYYCDPISRNTKRERKLEVHCPTAGSGNRYPVAGKAGQPGGLGDLATRIKLIFRLPVYY